MSGAYLRTSAVWATSRPTSTSLVADTDCKVLGHRGVRERRPRERPMSSVDPSTRHPEPYPGEQSHPADDPDQSGDPALCSHRVSQRSALRSRMTEFGGVSSERSAHLCPLCRLRVDLLESRFDSGSKFPVVALGEFNKDRHHLLGP